MPFGKYILILTRQNSFTLPPVVPFKDQLALPPVAPFAGPDGVLMPLISSIHTTEICHPVDIPNWCPGRVSDKFSDSL